MKKVDDINDIPYLNNTKMWHTSQLNVGFVYDTNFMQIFQRVYLKISSSFSWKIA